MFSSEAYIFKFNIKIVGVPTVTESETSQHRADLCLTLFAALGVDQVLLKNIDTAHQVPSSVASNRPNAIICKFMRWFARDKAVAAWVGVSNLNAGDLGCSDKAEVSLNSHIKLQRAQNAAARFICHVSRFDHITPSLYFLHCFPIINRIQFKISLFAFEALNGLAPLYISELLQHKSTSRYNLRSSVDILAGSQIFKIAASRFVNVSEVKINVMKENAIPRNTKHATKFGKTLFKGKM